jgi:hypothetical protein
MCFALSAYFVLKSFEVESCARIEIKLSQIEREIMSCWHN